MLWLLPLIAAVLAVLPLTIQRVHHPSRLLVSRAALGLFGRYVANDSPRKESQQLRMRAAHVGTTHRVYAARTLLYAAVLAVTGSVAGVYLVALALTLLRVGGDAIRAALPAALGFLAGLTQLGSIGGPQLFALLLFSSATVGAGLALSVYYARWALLDQRASARAAEIEATLPRTIAFVYALSRSGMAFPAVLNTLTDNEAVYGEAAAEIAVAVRDMNTFGTDVLTALRELSEYTPSEEMGEFSENLASVLGSGRDLSGFLRSQYERYREEAESQQRQYLDLLSTFAEAYVTVLVAGPLFFITILVVIGLVLQDTIDLLRVVVYAGIPLATAGFVVYIDSVTGSLGDTGGRSEADDEGTALTVDPTTGLGAASDPAPRGAGVADGGTWDDRWRVERERLAAYDSIERVIAVARSPGDALLRNPWATFLFTVPLGVGWIALRAGAVPLEPLALARTLDHPIGEATLGAVAAYAIVYRIEKRRLQGIERAVPDFLDRFASVNDAGMSVVESLSRLADSDLGALTPEVRRARQDVRWGADVATALRRLDRRVGSATVSRAVTLVTNSMAASGDVAPVLEIAADEARAGQRLRRERRQEMFTYLLVIYISFLVFLGIIAALTISFVPAIQNAQFESVAGGQVPGGVGGGLFAGLGESNTGTYTLLFFHVSLIQSVCSGLVAGQLGEGELRDGAKHAALLLALTLLAFAAMGQP